MAEPQLSKTRFYVVFVFFLVTLTGLWLRLGFIQIFESSRYHALAQSQSRVILEMQPTRGRILDRRGRELAQDVRMDSLYAVARRIEKKSQIAQKLSPILGLGAHEILTRLERDKLFVWIARKLSAAKADAVRRLKIPDLEFVKESQRVYPKGETACHLLGFTDIDNNGLEGVELHYNSFLRGVRGWRLSERDAKQRELISKQIEMVPPIDGYNVHLTIDEVIQAIAEKELKAACEKYNAKGGCILALDPKTGDVLAMAVYPLYDLNRAGRAKIEHRRNRAITDLFEPGSVFKMFTLSAILENKAIRLNEKFDCERGSWAVAGRVLHDHHGSGVLTFREVIERSSNIGTVKAALRLGGPKLYETFKAFGFGERSGIALAGEINGILPHPKNWSRSTIINLPIGQGVAVTPLQLAQAAAAIANDGLLMRPRIVAKIEDAEGKVVQEFPPVPVRRVISKETSLQVRSVLEGAVARGTGKKAVVPGFKAAGKTGTAQKIENGTYSHDRFVASFVGFVPYDEPLVTIAVSIDEPHPVIFGGEVAAPAFSRTAEAILGYWRVSQTAVPEEVSKSGRAPLKKKARKPTQKILETPLETAPRLPAQ